ncbi:MAG: methyltransferase domain-containing protein [Chloroflexota bacterium]
MTDNPTIATYDRIAGRYAERNVDRSWLADRYTSFSEAIVARAPTHRFRILDAGCGPGWDSRWFHERGFQVIGVDLSTGMLTEARHRAPDVDFHQADLRRLDFPDAYFDGIWCCASLLHLPRADAPTVLVNFRRMLGHGYLYLSVKLGQGEEVEEAAYGRGQPRAFTYYSRLEVELLLDRAGFEVRQVWDNSATSEQPHPFLNFLAQTQLQTPLLGAIAVVVDSAGRVLMSERADGRGWNLPAGFVDASEGPDEAVVRETREETGLEVEIDRLVGVYTWDRIHRHQGVDRCLVTTASLCHVVGGALVPTKEALQHGWFDPSDPPTPMASRYHLAILRDALAIRDGALPVPVVRRWRR